MMVKYRVNWDNGASACGTFPYTFDAREDADAYGKDWAYESNVRDFGHPDGPQNGEAEAGYSYDVIEVDVPDEEDGEEVAWNERAVRSWRP